MDVDVVNVLSTVHDKRGALVNDLDKEDFEVFENGRRQNIRYFARETDLPLTIALLVDVSGSVHAVIDEEKEAAAQFFQTVLRPSDQALLVGFSSTVILWQDFSSSTDILNGALGRLRPIPFKGLPLEGPMPSTLLYDSIYMAANQKLRDIPGRKVMIVISDGLDNGSRTHLDTVAGALESANTITYGICYQDGFSGCEFLKELADPTGGRMFQAGRKVPLSNIFASIEEEMRSQYAIGYVPLNRAHDGTFRRIRIRVRRQGLRVRARKGYFAAQDDPER